MLFTNSMVSPLATVILLGCGSNDERRNRGEFFWLRFTEKRTNETEKKKRALKPKHETTRAK